MACHCRELVIPGFAREVIRAALLRAYIPAVKVDGDTAGRTAFSHHDMGILPEETTHAEITADGRRFGYGRGA